MKRFTILLIYLFIFVGCASTKETPPQEFGGKPDVFSSVIQKPDPLLMGTWECRFLRTVGKSRPDANYVKYRLIKQDDKYGLYFYRTWRDGRKKKAEWKNWTINGKEILENLANLGSRYSYRARMFILPLEHSINRPRCLAS